MLQVPFGMKMGAKVSVGSYIVHSMIPVFIGNTIAGAMPTRSPDNLLSISGGADLSLSQTMACAQHCKTLHTQSQQSMFWHSRQPARTYSPSTMNPGRICCSCDKTFLSRSHVLCGNVVRLHVRDTGAAAGQLLLVCQGRPPAHLEGSSCTPCWPSPI